MGEKTEKATPKKLRDARKKGQIAKAQDLPSAFTFIASVAVTLALTQFLYTHLADFITHAFQLVTRTNMEITLPLVMKQALIVIFISSIPVMLAVNFVGIIVNFLAVGPVFAPEVFKFDIKKFNPIDNLKGKFKMKTLIELLKSTLKISIAGYLIYLVMWKSIPVLIQTSTVSIVGALLVFNSFLMEVLTKVGLFFIIIAIADFIYQKKAFAKEMKMEKFEIKQEYKNTEGDPQIKSKRKHIAQEIAYQEGPATGVKRAQAVVTNPTHLAVALAYDKEVDSAPYIVAKGDGLLAERIIKLAAEYNVPVMRNIALAHQLYDAGELNEYVPEDTYEAIAEILRWLASLNNPSE